MKLKLLSQNKLELTLSSSALVITVEAVSPVDSQHAKHGQERADAGAGGALQVEGAVFSEIVPMRGYTDGSLTPYSPEATSDNMFSKANIYTKANIELRFPAIIQPSSTIYGVVFFEAGNAWYDRNTFSPFDLKRTAGVGVRAFLPMFGMLGIDWGYGFDRDNKGGGRKGEFQFILGQQF